MQKKSLTWLSAVLVMWLAFPAAAQFEIEEVPAAPELVATEGLLDEEQAGAFVRGRGDDFKAPLAAERFELRQQALKAKLSGKAAGKVHQVAGGQYVELGLERKDRVFVILVEYGDSKWTLPAATIVGPRHNQIAQPNRAVDNSSIWQADYNKAHYEDMYFNRMAAYYQTQSSGRYTVEGSVTEWVKVPFNGSRYGNNGMGDPGAWTLIADAINVWTKEQLASGKTLDEVKAYLQQFDVWDRYDFDRDGNFDEADGYIDHFQIVHAGAGEEVGGGILGSDAIWSHRWSVFYNFRNIVGPAFNRAGGVQFGGGWGSNPSGSTIGSASANSIGVAPAATQANVVNAHPVTPTGIWVLDYTIQPENGGLGVFAHEYGHDLGLPDQYDTTNAGTNGTGYWTLMSSGSYLGDGTTDIGSTPGDFSAWDKFQLGWLNYQTADSNRFGSFKLGPAETNTKQAQALVISLDPASNIFYLYNPAAGKLLFGTKAYWGGKADNLDTAMIRQVEVPTTAPVLRMQLSYDIETNWDYAYVSVSTDNGASWTNLAGRYISGASTLPLTTNANPNLTNLGNGITGTTGTGWRNASFDMLPYAGQTVLIRVRYKTDDFTTGKGILVDEVSLGSFYDGAEAEGGWTLAGFKVSNGVESSNAAHYYIAEFRQYRTYDKGLQTGPYMFSSVLFPDLVSHYPYQDGLLVWYWDTTWSNNNTSQHPGEGRSLVIDSHPQRITVGVQPPTAPGPLTLTWNSAVQTFDAPFTLEPTDTVSFGGRYGYAGASYEVSQTFPSQPGNPFFNDMTPYWFTNLPASSVIVPQTGTTIRVVSTSAQDSFMQVHVGPAK